MATYSSSDIKSRSEAQEDARTATRESGIVGKSALAGAGLGASIGTAALPVIGTAIGAALGGIGGAIYGVVSQGDAVDSAMGEATKRVQEEGKAKMISEIDSAANLRAASTLPGATTAETIATPSVSSTAMKNLKAAPTPYDAWNAAIYGG